MLRSLTAQPAVVAPKRRYAVLRRRKGSLYRMEADKVAPLWGLIRPYPKRVDE